MFRFTGYVMKFAPIGVMAAIAATVGGRGLVILVTLGKLVLVMYASLAIFVLVVVGGAALLIRVPFIAFLRTIREPFLIAFTTASSEAALPKSLEVMERFGVPKRIVSFVLPTGYSMNLDGSTLYLSAASMFVAQLAGVELSIGQQITMMLTLMLTSKGVAGRTARGARDPHGHAEHLRPAAGGRRHPAGDRPAPRHGPDGRQRDGQLHRDRRRRAVGGCAGRRADAAIAGPGGVSALRSAGAPGAKTRGWGEDE